MMKYRQDKQYNISSILGLCKTTGSSIWYWL